MNFLNKILKKIIEKVKTWSVRIKELYSSNNNKIVIIRICKILIMMIVIVSYYALYCYIDRPIYDEVGTMKGLISIIKNEKYFTIELSNKHVRAILTRLYEDGDIKFGSMKVTPRSYYYGLLTTEEYNIYIELQKNLVMDNDRLAELKKIIQELEFQVIECKNEKQKNLIKKYIHQFECTYKQHAGENRIREQMILETKVQNILRVVSYGCVILIVGSWIWK